MTITSTQRTIFGDGTGADGRVIADADLNEIGNGATRRAWEVPGYANLLGFDQVTSTDYDTVFFNGTAEYKYGRARGVFTVGGGLQPRSSVLGVSMGAGMLGVWNDSTPDPPTASGVCQMMWVHTDGASGVTCDDEATGYKRWDLIYCTIAEANASTVLRHWEDATTGAKTSESVVPARVMTVTLAIVKGTASNAGAETVPAIPAGAHALYAAHVDGDAGGADIAGISELLDFTIPVGPLRKVLQPGTDGAFQDDQWSSVASGKITSLTTGTRIYAYFRAPGLCGQGEARLLRLRLSHKIATGGTCKLVKTDATLGVTVLADLSGSLAPDGSDKVMDVDVRGYPANALGGVYWGNGGQIKDQSASSSGLALQIAGADPDAGGSIVYSVEWFFVGG